MSRGGTRAARPSTSAHARPPCVSATPRATYRPILLPAPVPGRRGSKRLSASSAVSSVPARHAVRRSRGRSPVRRSIVIGPSRRPPDLRLVERQERASSAGRDPGSHGRRLVRPSEPSGCSESRRTESDDARATSSERSTRSGNSSSEPDATRPASTSKRRIASIRSASCTMPRQHQRPLLLRHATPTASRARSRTPSSP